MVSPHSSALSLSFSEYTGWYFDKSVCGRSDPILAWQLPSLLPSLQLGQLTSCLVLYEFHPFGGLGSASWPLWGLMDVTSPLSFQIAPLVCTTENASFVQYYVSKVPGWHFPKQGREFLNPWSRTVQQYCWTTCVSGSCHSKANSCCDSSATGMPKKASFKSKTKNQLSSPRIVVSKVYRLGTSGWKSWTISLITLESWTKRYSAEFGFFTRRIGVLYGDLQGLINPVFKNFLRIGWIPFRPLTLEDAVLD